MPAFEHALQRETDGRSVRPLTLPALALTRRATSDQHDGRRDAGNGIVTATRAALGFRAHSGWAAAVAVSGPPSAPEVVGRRRIEIADAGDPDAKQPYHAAEGLDLEDAERLVRRCTQSSQRLARAAVGAMLVELRAAGHSVVGGGLLQGSGRALPSLAGILASHALIHTAEGQMFRDILAEAARHHDLPVIEVRERELMAHCATDGLSADKLTRRLAEMGRALGPPWRQDEKLATLAAWLALAATK